jgi:putative RecB family exonuclease
VGGKSSPGPGSLPDPAYTAPVQRVFSHSSLSAFETCPKKYQFRYVLKVPVETEGIEAFVGKRVHEVLERLYQFAAQGMVPSLARVLARFRANWAESFDAGRLRIVRSEQTPEDYLRSGERCLENAYRRLYPFDDETVGLEREIAFPLDDEGRYPVRGVIDRLVRARDGALEIHDYKTGRRVPSQEDLDRDRQLALYEIGVRAALREEGEVRLVWHYLFPNQVRSSRRTPEQLAELRGETCAAIDRIRAETGWEARPGKLCAWCEYRTLCPAFASAAPAPEAPPPDFEPPELGEGQLSLW